MVGSWPRQPATCITRRASGANHSQAPASAALSVYTAWQLREVAVACTFDNKKRGQDHRTMQKRAQVCCQLSWYSLIGTPLAMQNCDSQWLCKQNTVQTHSRPHFSSSNFPATSQLWYHNASPSRTPKDLISGSLRVSRLCLSFYLPFP